MISIPRSRRLPPNAASPRGGAVLGRARPQNRLQEDGGHRRGGRGRDRSDHRRDARLCRQAQSSPRSKTRSTRCRWPRRMRILAERRRSATSHPDRADAGELRPHRRADRQAGRPAADPRLRARHGLRGVCRPAGRGHQRHRPAGRFARGDRRAGQGRSGHAGPRAGADRALSARSAHQGLSARGQQGPSAVRS